MGRSIRDTGRRVLQKIDVSREPRSEAVSHPYATAGTLWTLER